MAKQYFHTIRSSGKIPDLDYVTIGHDQKLNAYLAEVPGREVHHMNSISFMEDNGQTYRLVTILCCEDEVSEVG